MALNRREFLKQSACAGAGLLVAPPDLSGAPDVLTAPRTAASTAGGKLIFRPQLVQSGAGPHLLDWAYATDEKWDAFHSDIAATGDGVTISDTEGQKKFGIDVRWNVEGFGYIFITADNGGEFYSLPPKGRETTLNLNFELAKSRVLRNRRRFRKFLLDGWKPSRDVGAFLEAAESLYDDASAIGGDENKRGALAQRSLSYAMWGAEMMELDKARFDIGTNGRRPGFLFGCDARAFYQMYQPRFLETFSELFNYAAITYVVRSDDMLVDFEPEEGRLNFTNRDVLFRALRERGLTVQGRLLFWFHKWVTPDWLKNKSYDQLRKYVERHARDVIGHYPEGMYSWEIMNELHDWANEVALTPDQTVELTRLACDVARDTNPKVHRLINNCCPFAEYVQLKQWSGQDARHPQRTPWEFTRDLVDAKVDFTILGQQMYFPYRDLQDIQITIERLEGFGKPVQLSEIGAPAGPTNDSVRAGKVGFPKEPFTWRRPWDEELQADWLEGVYTLGYSKPFVEGVSWFDLVDPYSYIENGGLLRSPSGEKKPAFDRLKTLEARWNALTHHGRDVRSR